MPNLSGLTRNHLEVQHFRDSEISSYSSKRITFGIKKIEKELRYFHLSLSCDEKIRADSISYSKIPDFAPVSHSWQELFSSDESIGCISSAHIRRKDSRMSFLLSKEWVLSSNVTLPPK
jgi:hypothetical protein